MYLYNRFKLHSTNNSDNQMIIQYSNKILKTRKKNHILCNSSKQDIINFLLVLNIIISIIFTSKYTN